MNEYTPKTDEEIEWEEMVYKAEKEDFERWQKKPFFEVAFGLVLEMSWKLAVGAIIFVLAGPLFIYLAVRIPSGINTF